MYFVTLCLLAFAATVQGKCEGGCSVPVTHYKELGCEPVFANVDDCCPTHYNCAKIEGRAADKCYHNGEVYNAGDTLDSKLTSENCLAACFCSSEAGRDFVCAHIDCPEFFGHQPLQPECYRAYQSGQCCSTKTVCPPFDKIAKCEVAGKTYHEGQRFEAPGNGHLNCLCLPNFKGKFEAPFCIPVKCGIELTNSVAVRTKCAPVYYGTNGVCPIQWECEDNVESVQIAKERSGVDKKCNFGTKELNVGDKVILKRFSKHSPEINCECRIPPLITCVQKPHEI